MKRLIGAILISALVITGCQREADLASYNVSAAADQFEVYRRVVFFNGITDTYLLVIEGLCSLGNNDKTGELTVTCKVGPTTYKKHFLGLSDNVSYFVEHLQGTKLDSFHYRVTFRPSVIIPDLDIR